MSSSEASNSSCSSNTSLSSLSLDSSSDTSNNTSKTINIEYSIPKRKKHLENFNLLNDDRVLNNLLFMEDNYCIQSNYFLYIQNEIKPWMRTVLSNWMLEVCENQKCDDDVFALAMNILDRFLSVQQIGKRHLQLLGSVCMFIASKVRSTVPLSAETLIVYTDQSITIEELLNWEQLVLHRLHWDVCSITANDFLPYLLKKLSFINNRSVNDTIFKQHLSTFIALCSTDFRFSVLTPSMIASGCILNAIELLMNNTKNVNEKILEELSNLTCIEMDCLKECKEQIEELIESNYQLMPEIADMVKTKTVASDLENSIMASV